MRHRAPRPDRQPRAPQGQPPGVRELLRMLFDDAKLRLRTATLPKLVQPPVPKAVLLLFEQHQKTRARLREINQVLKSHGYHVQDYGDHLLQPVDSAESKHRAAWEAQQAKRLQRVRELHQQALLDLLTLQGRDARAYLERLRDTLAQETK